MNRHKLDVMLVCLVIGLSAANPYDEIEPIAIISDKVQLAILPDKIAPELIIVACILAVLVILWWTIARVHTSCIHRFVNTCALSHSPPFLLI